MKKRILIDANFPRETRVVKLDHNNTLEAFEYETSSKDKNKGNVYLVKVIRVEASLQAAFVEYAKGKNGFLPFSEILPSYYQGISSKDIQEDVPMDIVETTEFENQFEEDVELLENTKPVHRYHKYKIQDVIFKDQILLAQVQKEERGNKGASFTTYISLAGKYCVFIPTKPKHHGISRRISSNDERKRLHHIIDKMLADEHNYSLILRTASTGRSAHELKKDYDYLVNLWEQIQNKASSSVAPAFIHMEDGIIQKTIRDLYDKEVEEIIVQGHEAFLQAKSFMKNILPTDVGSIKEYKSKTPILSKIEDTLSNLYQPVVTLPSGGYIVINPTEALTAIDVNSGKSTKENSIEETALKTNMEAAKEIATQLRLRDIAGLIVIDFIDMSDNGHRKMVEKSLKDLLEPDKAKTQLGNISNFGLLEMSRQRLRASFLESNAVICNHCNGKGLTRAEESNAMLILRTLENEIYKGQCTQINIYAHLNSILYLMNHKRNEIQLLENKYDLKIYLYQENSSRISADAFSVEKIKKSNNGNGSQSAESENPHNNNQILVNEQENANIDGNDNQNIQATQKKHRRKNRNQRPHGTNTSSLAVDHTDANLQDVERTNVAEIVESVSQSVEGENIIIQPEAELSSEGVEIKKRKITKKFHSRFRGRNKKTSLDSQNAPQVNHELIG